MESHDIIVVGAGLAGLQCARLLSGHGLRVLLVDRKASLDQAVHTTGIFVRRSLDDFSLPPACLGPPIRHVTLYSPARRKLELESPHEEFRIGRMGMLYARMLKDCQAAGAQWLGNAQYLGCQPIDGGSRVQLRVDSSERTVEARFIVAADGANSRVARDLELSVNSRWIVGLEEVVTGVPLDGPPRLHCFLDHRVAPGYIAWVAADGENAHIGVGGYPENFQVAGALAAFRASLGSIVDLGRARFVERRGGRIPVGGVLPKIINSRGLLVGDAAGATSPLTAGGLDPCLRLTQLAARVAWQYLSSGDASHLAAYDGRYFRRRFTVRRGLRVILSQFGHNGLLEAACAVLRTRPGTRLARHVFFGRGSFPDVLARGAKQPAERPRLPLKPQNPKAVAVN